MIKMCHNFGIKVIFCQKFGFYRQKFGFVGQNVFKFGFLTWKFVTILGL